VSGDIQPLSLASAREFAAGWLSAWNAHDPGRVLDHYTPDVDFTSPFVARATGEQSGRLRGAEALLAYVVEALERFPDLAFRGERLFIGTGSLTLTYTSRFAGRDRPAAEVMVLQGGRAATVLCHYAADAGP
jgi:ketosteroid isomerase-like protein